MILDLIIPDLFLPLPPGGALDIYPQQPLPDLETLLARASRAAASGSDLESCLLAHFGAPPIQSGIAALSLLADGGQPENRYWLRADPVHLQAQRDKLVLVCGELMAITQNEANALVDALNQHYADDDMKFFCLQPERWYVTSNRIPDLVTHPLPQVAGQAINDKLPSGADGKLWQSRMNEMQMLLHMHPVNLARENAGLPILNSVWFWGGGTLPAIPPRPARRCWADETLTRGLARAAGCPTHPLPSNADAWLNQAAPNAEHLIVWDQPRHAAQYGDYAAWHACLAQFETEWAKPLLRALRDGRVDRLNLHAVSAHSVQTFSLNRAATWRFWRRRKSLKQYAPAIS